MLRRIAVTLATVATAGLVAAAPAAATGWEGGKIGAEYAAVEGSRASGEILNLGGPYGITYVKGEREHFEAERGQFLAEYAQGR
ncbi:hypothetical protein EES43_00730 [Streptomyces sp. ADI96-02]|uniref:hypothetical protein n=1 Tax=unclassified Streptomyces TaxID=2593676 RepID=UPI000F552C10|nr:hypothetical protein [Streptomyces sp. ADI96-02]RPK69087.1 hypothetical protein EES43_00730 [Streptomyces sp. ADI96-02]